MSAFGFPASPNDGDVFSKWVYSASKGAWVLQSTTGTITDLFIDEDDMVSDTAAKVPTQQSTKAYVDAAVQNIDVDQILANDIITEAEGIASNDTDGVLPTSAAVKDYVDNAIPATLLDEDTMASDDATRAPTQQSTKAYVDNSIAAINGLTVSQFDGSAVVTEAEGIGSNDNDTTVATSAAVKDYVDTAIATEGHPWVENGSNIGYTAGSVGIGTTSPSDPLHVVGSTTIEGGISMPAATTEARNIEIGTGRSGNGFAFIDLVGDATYTDYGFRMIRHNSGANSLSEIVHRGTGNLEFRRVETGNIVWRVGSTARMMMTTAGLLHCDNDVVAFSTTVSDAQFKNQVETISNPLDKVLALRGVEYTWNKGSRKGQRDMGLIAQEVEAVIPNIVREREMVTSSWGTEDDKPIVAKTVDYEKLTGLLIEAVKELTARVEELESNK